MERRNNEMRWDRSWQTTETVKHNTDKWLHKHSDKWLQSRVMIPRSLILFIISTRSQTDRLGMKMFKRRGFGVTDHIPNGTLFPMGPGQK
jgi:hypothetical protein